MMDNYRERLRLTRRRTAVLPETHANISQFLAILRVIVVGVVGVSMCGSGISSAAFWKLFAAALVVVLAMALLAVRCRRDVCTGLMKLTRTSAGWTSERLDYNCPLCEDHYERIIFATDVSIEAS